MTALDLALCYRQLGLVESPFSITHDTEYFFPGSRHREALNHLRFGMATGGLTMLTGEVGVGKTLLCRYLIRHAPPRIRLAYLLNPDQTYPDLLRSIYEDLTAETMETFSIGILQRALVHLLLHCAERGERVVILIDEAQRLSPRALERLRLLSNLDTEKDKLLCLLFVSQPELERTLAKKTLRPLAQRISVRYHLEAFDAQETLQCIQHRLAVSRRRRRLRFSPSALWLTHLISGGVPRRINQICDRALLAAYAVNQYTVSPWMVWRAAREIHA